MRVSPPLSPPGTCTVSNYYQCIFLLVILVLVHACLAGQVYPGVQGYTAPHFPPRDICPLPLGGIDSSSAQVLMRSLTALIPQYKQVGNYTIRLSMLNKDSKWTKALKLMLADLKV
jgi:hypothetical protein